MAVRHSAEYYESDPPWQYAADDDGDDTSPTWSYAADYASRPISYPDAHPGLPQPPRPAVAAKPALQLVPRLCDEANVHKAPRLEPHIEEPFDVLTSMARWLEAGEALCDVLEADICPPDLSDYVTDATITHWRLVAMHRAARKKYAKMVLLGRE